MRKEKASWLMLVILILACATTQSINIVLSEPTTTISIEPPISKAAPSETFSVDANVTDVTNLFEWNIVINFNPAILNATSLTRGHFFEKPGYWTAWQIKEMQHLPWGVINNTAGFIIIGDTFMPPLPSSGVTGDGTLLTINFLVKTEGATSLSFNKDQTRLTTLVGTTPIEIPHETVDGFFTNLEVGWVEGTVTDADTTLPIEGATVSANGVSNVTDASGAYSLEVSPGTYDVTASMAGYESQTATAVSVLADETVTQDFALVPIPEVGWVEGTVTDADTTLPIEGATVSANGVSNVTDASGAYSIEVSPGTYDVTASMTGYESQTVMAVSVLADETVTQDFALAPIVGDVTPPTITINEPIAKDYLHSETIILDFGAVDAESGIASISATLDGETVENGDSIELFTLSLGTHTLTVTAVDNAGNSATETLDFNIIATVDSLQDLVTMFYESGYFHSPKGMYTSFIKKLYAAEAYINAGKISGAKGVLGAFINHAEAQSGKHLDEYAANILIADARYVIDHL